MELRRTAPAPRFLLSPLGCYFRCSGLKYPSPASVAGPSGVPTDGATLQPKRWTKLEAPRLRTAPHHPSALASTTSLAVTAIPKPPQRTGQKSHGRGHISSSRTVGVDSVWTHSKTSCRPRCAKSGIARACGRRPGRCVPAPVSCLQLLHIASPPRGSVEELSASRPQKKKGTLRTPRRDP